MYPIPLLPGLHFIACVRVALFLDLQFVPTALASLIPQSSPEGIQLMNDLMLYDPSKRPTAAQALQYPFFMKGIQIPAAIPAPGHAEPIPAAGL